MALLSQASRSPCQRSGAGSKTAGACTPSGRGGPSAAHRARRHRSPLRAASLAHHTASCDSDSDEQAQQPSSATFARILRFVEENSTPRVVPAHVNPAALLVAGVSAEAQLQAAAPAASTWHHSYDEEAEEGCSSDCERAASGALASSAGRALDAAEAARRALAAPLPGLDAPLQPWVAACSARGSAAPAPSCSWQYSYDEEAELDPVAAAAIAAAAALSPRRRRRRSSSRPRVPRAQLAASLGALEAMQPWMVEPAPEGEHKQRARVRLPSLPQQRFVLTFDEEAGIGGLLGSAGCSLDEAAYEGAYSSC